VNEVFGIAALESLLWMLLDYISGNKRIKKYFQTKLVSDKDGLNISTLISKVLSTMKILKKYINTEVFNWKKYQKIIEL
jgi:hypothetical protein